GAPAAAMVAAVTSAFHASHERTYGYAFEGTPLECLTFRVTVAAPGPAPKRRRGAAASAGVTPGASQRPVRWVPGAKPVATPVRAGLRPGEAVAGPLIVERP